MLKLVRNCDEALIPKSTTATSAKTRPTSHRTSGRSRSRKSGAKVRPPLAQGRREPERDPAVEGDRAEQQRTGDGLVPERPHTENVQRRQDRVQEQRAERGADDASATAEDRDAPDHDGGDHLQL